MDGLNQIDFEPQLILIFGGKTLLQQSDWVQEIRRKFPQAIMAGCSTAGEISGTTVSDESLSLNFLAFERSEVRYQEYEIQDNAQSYEAGKTLAQSFEAENLKHLFVLSDGLNVNGSQLVDGLREGIPENVSITGGLAGDGPLFEQTLLIDNEGHLKDQLLIALGFYGDLEVNYGSMGGWDSFGIERLVTKSRNNVLYELDHQPALQLYKSFLGDEARNLPASGLLFPLSMRYSEDKQPLVRTILGVSEKDQSLTFAGDIPEGSSIRLMKANVNRLIDGAEEAADLAKLPFTEFAICISCVGRKLVLRQIVEEEIEAVAELLGPDCLLTGFYSYGEIAPFKKGADCELHNQTMTITSFSEIEKH
ncbi:FIST C-terminal domain-containing protein [Croceimicrobium hydrocarbonivorans]|uniref:FIST C-terminal domain-containing protein n=2 Tax=Croceimicrobium hydrocarbonivorans TaxID=2761580 RepID=A0A7H0VJZ0_9FLAO|nr:FIST C-terminal domain-containing protein [Croceimicrobium hydrocarbonivorans]